MINLMPPKLKDSVKYGSYNVSLIQYISLVIIAGLALGAVIAFGVQIVRSDSAKLNDSITTKQLQKDEYAADTEKAETLTSKIATVNTLLDNEIEFSAVIQEIGRLMPPGTALSSLRLTNDLDENIDLSARASSKQVITELQQNLIGSELFTGADIQNIGYDGTSSSPLKYTVALVVSFDKVKVISL